MFLVPQIGNVESPSDSGSPQGTGGSGTGGSGTGGGAMMFPPNAGGGPGNEPVCEKSRHPQEPRPLGVYMMVDRSSAMKAKWESVTTALTDFVARTDTLGKVSVGLTFYAKPWTPTSMTPPTPEQQKEELCGAQTYVLPDVPILPTGDAVKPVEKALADNGPGLLEALLGFVFPGLPETLPSESPIGPAIQGAIQGAREWVHFNEREQRKAVVLLVTDTIADADKSPICLPSLESAVEAAESGLLTDGPSIRTYVLGVGGVNQDLDAVAMAGGTGAAYLSDQGGDLLPSLELIRERALPCDIEPDASVDVTSNLVNVDVRYTSDGKERFQNFYRVPGEEQCGREREDEWYSDGDASDVAVVRLCPSACNHARSLAGSSIEVVYGCSSRKR